MNKRIKELRKTLGLTLEKFGEPIGIKKSGLSHIENGKNALTEQNIKSICRVYNVNEDWLCYGQGEMFKKLDAENELMAWAGRVLAEKDDTFKKRFIKMLMALDEDEWEVLAKFMSTMVDDKKD